MPDRRGGLGGNTLWLLSGCTGLWELKPCGELESSLIGLFLGEGCVLGFRAAALAVLAVLAGLIVVGLVEVELVVVEVEVEVVVVVVVMVEVVVVVVEPLAVELVKLLAGVVVEAVTLGEVLVGSGGNEVLGELEPVEDSVVVLVVVVVVVEVEVLVEVLVLGVCVVAVGVEVGVTVGAGGGETATTPARAFSRKVGSSVTEKLGLGSKSRAQSMVSGQMGNDRSSCRGT